MAATITSDHLRVRVGSGRKAHLFSPAPGADAKRFMLEDGDTVYDYTLCGNGGALVEADDDLDLCKTCATLDAR